MNPRSKVLETCWHSLRSAIGVRISPESLSSFLDYLASKLYIRPVLPLNLTNREYRSPDSNREPFDPKSNASANWARAALNHEPHLLQKCLDTVDVQPSSLAFFHNTRIASWSSVLVLFMLSLAPQTSHVILSSVLPTLYVIAIHSHLWSK